MFDEKISFLATMGEYSHGNPQMMIGTLKFDPQKGRTEKNWLPLLNFENQPLLLIYSYQPLTLLKSDLITGKTEVYKQLSWPINSSRFRGSGICSIENDIFASNWKGYLMVVHESIDYPEGRNYFHRFLLLSEQLELKAFSHPWMIYHHGVEFCRSVSLDLDQSSVLLGFGIEDRESWVYSVSMKTIKDQLNFLTP